MAAKVRPLSHITTMFKIPKGIWVWCLHCSRCYRVGEYKLVGCFKFECKRANPDSCTIDDCKHKLQSCPYEDCDGTPIDAWPWKEHRGKSRPAVPKRNVEYDLTGDRPWRDERKAQKGK